MTNSAPCCFGHYANCIFNIGSLVMIFLHPVVEFFSFPTNFCFFFVFFILWKRGWERIFMLIEIYI